MNTESIDLPRYIGEQPFLADQAHLIVTPKDPLLGSSMHIRSIRITQGAPSEKDNAHPDSLVVFGLWDEMNEPVGFLSIAEKPGHTSFVTVLPPKEDLVALVHSDEKDVWSSLFDSSAVIEQGAAGFPVDESMITQADCDLFLVTVLEFLRGGRTKRVSFFGDGLAEKVRKEIVNGAGRITRLNESTNEQTQVYSVSTELTHPRKEMLKRYTLNLAIPSSQMI